MADKIVNDWQSLRPAGAAPARPHSGPSPAAVPKYSLKDLLGTPPTKPAAVTPATTPAPPSSGVRTIPSAHGGKLIPVVPSRSAIAAAQKAQASKAAVLGFSYKDHILIGVRADSYDTRVIARWPHLPSQQEIDKALGDTKYPYLAYALTNPVNVWTAK